MHVSSKTKSRKLNDRNFSCQTEMLPKERRIGKKVSNFPIFSPACLPDRKTEKSRKESECSQHNVRYFGEKFDLMFLCQYNVSLIEKGILMLRNALQNIFLKLAIFVVVIIVLYALFPSTSCFFPLLKDIFDIYCDCPKDPIQSKIQIETSRKDSKSKNFRIDLSNSTNTTVNVFVGNGNTIETTVSK